MRRAAVLALGFVGILSLAACGGGGGGSGGDVSPLLTADPRGLTADPTYGGSGAPSALPDLGAGAAEAAGDLAREIEEADVCRTAGDTLYLLSSHRGLVTVDLASMRLLGRLGLDGFPHEAFLRGSRALVLVGGFDGQARLLDVNVANPAAPSLTAAFPLGGGYRTSRLVGDALLVVTDTQVLQFSVGASVAAAGALALPEGALFVHATDGLLAIAAMGDGSETTIRLVSFTAPPAPPVLRGSIALPGWVSDEWKMHVGAGTLRVVTHDWADGAISHLFTISLANLAAPSVLGTLDLARGEQLFATRFSDEAAYVVTFEQVDPLWVVDLRDPAHPAVSGSLTVPGYSTHLVPVPGRLVALGIDPAAGWDTIVSLFDVSDPAAPALLDREDFGAGWSTAFYDVKGFGVFPAEGLVLVPYGGETDRLAVLSLSSSSLALRGAVDVEGPVLRGLPHARGIVAASNEEVVLADASTLAVLGRATIAENVVDAARLPDGRTLELVAKRASGRLGPVALPLVPERCYPHGDRVAVTGFDDLGRACYVVDFGTATPSLSARFDLGGGWYGIDPMPAMGMRDGLAYVVPWGGDAAMTPAGRLVVRGLPGATWGGGGGTGPGPMPMPMAAGGAASDGFVVVDVARSALGDPVEVDGVVSGFALEGETLLYTVGQFEQYDREGRPWMSHDLVSVDLAAGASAGHGTVPGWVVAASGGLAFLAEERWDAGWSCTLRVASVSIAGGRAEVLGRLALPEGAFDLRAAGATLLFTAYEGGGGVVPTLPPGVDVGIGGGTAAERPVWDDAGMALPSVRIGSVRLAASPSEGPSIDATAGFATLLLPEDGAALVVRDGVTVERWLVSGTTATLDWSAGAGAYPLTARAVPAGDAWLVALGYGGLLVAP